MIDKHGTQFLRATGALASVKKTCLAKNGSVGNKTFSSATSSYRGDSAAHLDQAAVRHVDL